MTRSVMRAVTSCLQEVALIIARGLRTPAIVWAAGAATFVVLLDAAEIATGR